MRDSFDSDSLGTAGPELDDTSSGLQDAAAEEQPVTAAPEVSSQARPPALPNGSEGNPAGANGSSRLHLAGGGLSRDSNPDSRGGEVVEAAATAKLAAVGEHGTAAAETGQHQCQSEDGAELAEQEGATSAREPHPQENANGLLAEGSRQPCDNGSEGFSEGFQSAGSDDGWDDSDFQAASPQPATQETAGDTKAAASDLPEGTEHSSEAVEEPSTPTGRSAGIPTEEGPSTAAAVAPQSADPPQASSQQPAESPELGAPAHDGARQTTATRAAAAAGQPASAEGREPGESRELDTACSSSAEDLESVMVDLPEELLLARESCLQAWTPLHQQKNCHVWLDAAR